MSPSSFLPSILFCVLHLSFLPAAPFDSASPFWSNLVDGKPQQFLLKGDVDFIKYPGWFLAEGHPLGRSTVTKTLSYLCTPKRGEELRVKRPAIDWRRAKPMLTYTPPYTAMVDTSMLQFWTTIIDEDDIRKMNQEVMFSGHRRTSRCHIAYWSAMLRHPLFFILIVEVLYWLSIS